MGIGRGIRVTLAAALIAACGSLAVPARVIHAQATPDATQPASGDVIQVPIRWCALEGTTTATDPLALSEPDTDSVLLSRLERVTDQIWLPGANIVFRSAMTVDVPAPAHFPIIRDPNPPTASAGGPGKLGDVLAPSTGDPTERDDAVAACETAWDALAAAAGVTLNGLIAISVQHFVLPDGTPVTEEAQSGMPAIITTTGPTDPCPKLSEIASVRNGFIAVADPSTVTVDDTTLLAHELGHMLNLRHGNGLDDNTNGAYDQYCDFGELKSTPRTVMDASVSVATGVITDRQREEARAVATKIEGAVVLSDDVDVALFLVCLPEPDMWTLGDPVTVEASGFRRPIERVRLDLGDETFAEGELDGSDSVKLEPTVPFKVLPGPRLLTIGVAGSALTAHCVIEVAA